MSSDVGGEVGYHPNWGRGFGMGTGFLGGGTGLGFMFPVMRRVV